MAGWENPNISTVKMKVDLNEDGFIAREGENVSGSKVQKIKGLKIDGNINEATALFQKIVGDISGASFDTSTSKKEIAYTVDKPKYSEIYNEVDFTDTDIAPIFDGTYQTQGTINWVPVIDKIFAGSYTANQNSIFSVSDFDKMFSKEG